MRRDDPLGSLQATLTATGRQVAAVVAPAAPFVLQAAVSMAAYTTGLAAAQSLGTVLRISCATPVLGPIGGVIGVGFASALAGQASRKCVVARREGWRRALVGPGSMTRGVRRQDLVLDAMLGIAAFRVMGGRFRSVMPSDLTRVGAIAKESIPAAGMRYAGDEKRRELLRVYRRDGCHHCGKRSGRVIGDHMPPNKHVQEHINATRQRLLGRAVRVPFVRKAASALGVPTGPPSQRYYPQCESCSRLQSSAVRNGVRRLVFHDVLHRGGTSSAWHYAGALIGLRYFSSSGGGSLGFGGKSGKLGSGGWW